MSEGCRHLLLARFDADTSELQALSGVVAGEHAPLSELPSMSDEALLHKYYKLNKEELEVGTLSEAVVARIATRDL